jgi:hypothetical protein
MGWGRSLIVTLLIILILATIVVGSNPHRGRLGGGEKGKRILIERRLGKWKLVELIEAELVVLAPLVAEEHILALPSVPTHAEHTLEHSQDITGGGGGRKWCSRAKKCGVQSSRGRRCIRWVGQCCQSLWLDVGDPNVLHKLYVRDIINHHYKLRGITTAVESSLGNVENLHQDVVKNWERLLLYIILDKVPFVLGTSDGIPNPRSQGGIEKVVKAVKLMQEVLNLQWGGPDTSSIHKEHILLLENVISVNPVIRLHSKLILKAKQLGKLWDCDLILSSICHPHKLMSIDMKVESGVELTDDLIVPIILEAHHLCHLELITSGFYAVEVGVVTGLHPLPVYPLDIYHMLLLVKVDGLVSIGVQIGPKPSIDALLAAVVHGSTTSFIDCLLLGLLGIFERHTIGPLLRRMHLESFRFLIFLTWMRGMMSWARRRRPTDHSGLVTPLGRAHHILPFLGALLMMGIHELETEKQGNN